MQARQLLQTRLKKSSGIHEKRLEALLVAVESLVKDRRLSVVSLGRGIINRVKPKYNINRMDRLVGNEHLYAESRRIQKELAVMLIGGKTRPVILVDWSSATVAERYQLLRAGVALGGRAITLYEEVHELAAYNNGQVHERFLNHLKEVLPPSCRPIVVTDAGFGVPWFKQVAQLGWDFVGRVINQSYYTPTDKVERWQSMTDLLNYQQTAIKQVGQVLLTKTHRFGCYIHVYKALSKGRISKSVYGTKSSRTVSKRNAKSARQAWVLANSLGEGQIKAKRVVKIYASRMQIEESFRDIKSPRFGFGLKYSHSSGIKRLSNLLLIGLIGTLIVWLAGLCAKRQGLHRGLQTNSIKDQNVLSVFFIGCQILKYPIKFMKRDILAALKQMKECVYVYQNL